MNAAEKNPNIELIRIAAMFMVVMTHVNTIVLPNVTLPQRVIFLLSENFIEGTTLFAMLSGYLLCTKNFKLSRCFDLFVHTVTFMVLGLIISRFVLHEALSLRQKLMVLFPVQLKAYWYVTAYMGVLIAMPLLNWIIDRISFKAAVTFVLIFCLTGFLKIWNSSGYDFIWLAAWYLVGGCCKKFEPDWSERLNSSAKRLSLWLCPCFFLTLAAVPSYWLEPIYKQFIPLFYRQSPLKMIGMIACFLFLLKLKLPTVVQKGTLAIGSLCFGVYLLHVNPYIFPRFPELKRFMVPERPVLSLLIALGLSLVIFSQES